MKLYFRYILLLSFFARIITNDIYAQSFKNITQLWLDRGSDRIRIQPVDQYVDGDYKYLVVDAGILTKESKLMQNEAIAFSFKKEEINDEKKSRSKLVLILNDENKYVSHLIFYISDDLDIVKIKHHGEKYYISTIGPKFEATIEVYNDEGKYIETLVSFDASYRVALSDFDVDDKNIVFTGTFDHKAYIVFKGDTIRQEFQNYTSSPVPWFPVGFIISMDIESEVVNYSKGFGCENDGNGISSITLDKERNIILAGSYNGPNFNFFGDTLPYKGGFGAKDAYLTKIDERGEKLWLHSFSSTSILDKINGVLIDEDNNVYAGFFSRDNGKLFLDNKEFDKNSYGYMMKFLQDGDLSWIKEFKGNAADMIPLFVKDERILFGCSYKSTGSITYLDNVPIMHNSDEGISLFFTLNKISGSIEGDIGIVSNGNRIDLKGNMNSENSNTVLFYNSKNQIDFNGVSVTQVAGLDYIYVIANIDILSSSLDATNFNQIGIFPSILSSNDLLMVHSQEQERYEYSIFNVDGKVIVDKEVLDNLSIDMSGFQSGLYFIKIKNKGRFIVKHFCVQN